MAFRLGALGRHCDARLKVAPARHRYWMPHAGENQLFDDLTAAAEVSNAQQKRRDKSAATISAIEVLHKL
jgi:hypothetical protein